MPRSSPIFARTGRFCITTGKGGTVRSDTDCYCCFVHANVTVRLHMPAHARHAAKFPASHTRDVLEEVAAIFPTRSDAAPILVI